MDLASNILQVKMKFPNLGPLRCMPCGRNALLVPLCLCFMGVCLGWVDQGGEIRSRHHVLWFRNHEYNALMWKYWSYYQSMGSEFRFDFG